MENRKVRQLNMGKIRNKKPVFASSRETLKDVIPIEWSGQVLSGKKNNKQNV